MDQPQPPIIDPPKKKATSWQNTIATYMSRHVRHVRARSNEWIRVHRSGGGDSGGGWNGGNLWVTLIFAAIALWVVYAVVAWIVGIIEAIVSAVFAFLSVAVPVVAVVLVVLFGLRLIRSK